MSRLGNVQRMLEQHYTVAELAKQWGYSTDTIRRAIEHEPGVIRMKKDRRAHIRIPSSVAERIYNRITQQ